MLLGVWAIITFFPEPVAATLAEALTRIELWAIAQGVEWIP